VRRPIALREPIHKVHRWLTSKHRNQKLSHPCHMLHSLSCSDEHSTPISSRHGLKETLHTLWTQDEVTRYRAVLRSQNLFNKNHSVTHNIITGEARPNPVPVPPAPSPPQ
jgi:hypothetical protein